ncbi:MAG: DUF4214 domain-containing protein [Clostridiales bacterium]|nr:DUF4214 domain-containing protein [Clostridiales bacterium]
MLLTIKKLAICSTVASSLLLGSISVAAAPAGSLTTDQTTVTQLGGTYEVSLSARDIEGEWFSFTAPEAGAYAFWTTEADHTVLLVYNEDRVLVNYAERNSSSGMYVNGRPTDDQYVSVVLDAGETCFVKAVTDYNRTDECVLHVTKGLCFYIEYDGEEYYQPFFGGSDFYFYSGDDITFRLVSSLDASQVESTGDYSYTPDSLAGIDEGTVTWEDVTARNLSYELTRRFYIDECEFRMYFVGNLIPMDRYEPLSISGISGDQFVSELIEPGSSYTICDTVIDTDTNSFGGFWDMGNMCESGMFMAPYFDFDPDTFTATFEHTRTGIEDFAMCRVYNYSSPINYFNVPNSSAYKTYFLFVPDENPGTLTLGQPYSVDHLYPGGNDYDFKLYEDFLTFTPEQSGSYTFSTTNLRVGMPNISVFASDYSRIGGVCSSYIRTPRALNLNFGRLLYFDRVFGDEVDCNNTLDTSRFFYDNVSMTVDLTAGETYYVAVGSFFDGIFDVNVSFNPPATEPTTEPSQEPLTEPSQEPSASEPSATEPAASEPSAQEPSATEPASTEPSVPADVPTQTVEVSNYSVGDFVERLYSVALGRSSDASGRQDWIDAVTLRGQTGADLARGFLYSPEFLNNDVPNDEFVKVLYLTFFNREADDAGLEGWVNALNNGESKESVIEGFINSSEWSNLCLLYGIRSGGTGIPTINVEPNQKTIDFATRLYTTCLGRVADEAGMMAWARQLSNQRDTGTGAAHGFFFSDEFVNQNVSNTEFVNRLYRTFMGREADEAGFNAWVAQLDSGVSREEVFNGFAGSQEFMRICADYGIIR